MIAHKSEVEANTTVRQVAHAGTGWWKTFGVIVAGYLPIYLVFEGSARLLAGLDGALRMGLTAIAVVGMTLAIEMLVFKQPIRQALRRLGLGRPGGGALLAAVLISLLMLACYPIIMYYTGAQFALPVAWAGLLLGVFVQNGIAEEMLYRGYLFRHLREQSTFRRAVLLGILLHAAAHIPVIFTAGAAVGLAAVLVAACTALPFAYLFERGRGTVWAPALIHFTADTLMIVTPADRLAEPGTLAGVLAWFVVISVLPYLAFFLRGTKLSTLNS